MSTPTTAVAAGTPPRSPAEARSITIVSHSNLFYWWPVWAVGFLMAFVTLITQTRAVVVPGESLKRRPAKWSRSRSIPPSRCTSPRARTSASSLPWSFCW